jgi:hypothetical protein
MTTTDRYNSFSATEPFDRPECTDRPDNSVAIVFRPPPAATPDTVSSRPPFTRRVGPAV